MQTLAFFIGISSTIIWVIMWVHSIIVAVVKQKSGGLIGIPLILMILSILSWTWLFYLTH